MKELKDSVNPHLGGCIHNGDPGTYDTVLWDFIIDKYKIRSVLDVCCGEGHSLSYFFNKGLSVLGIEGLREAIDNSPMKFAIVKHDYSKSSLSVKKDFDMIWCCEAVEHIDEEYLPNLLETFESAKYVFMTHALPGQGGYHHVNCKDDDYWIEKLGSICYEYLEEETLELRKITSARYIKPSLMVFKKY